MNDLTSLPPSLSLAKQTTTGLSQGLKTLLELGASSRDAVEAILAVPQLLDEARRALPALHTVATAPAGLDGVKAVIGRRFALFPQPERGQGEWLAWWSDYVEVLGDLPEGALEAGMREWLRLPNTQFLPKPGELRSLALATENRDVRAYERARRAVEYKPPTFIERQGPPIDPPPVRRMPTDVERSQAKQWAAEFAAQIPRQTVSNFPASHGPTDEHGVTAEMRAVMARQGR